MIGVLPADKPDLLRGAVDPGPMAYGCLTFLIDGDYHRAAHWSVGVEINPALLGVGYIIERGRSHGPQV